jgi:translation initiation factor IF-3
MSKEYKVNESITEQKVQVVLPDGNMFGIAPIKEAMDMAANFGLDLVEVSPSKGDQCAVCKIIDFGKLKYEQAKKMKQPRSHGLKEIKFNYRTADHDIMIKNKKAEELLEKRYKIRYSMELRGREKIMVNDAVEKLNTSLSFFENKAKWDKPQISNGGDKIVVFAVLSPC